MGEELVEEEEELVETSTNETVMKMNETEAAELFEQVNGDLDVEYIEKTFNESSLSANNTDVTDVEVYDEDEEETDVVELEDDEGEEEDDAEEELVEEEDEEEEDDEE